MRIPIFSVNDTLVSFSPFDDVYKEHKVDGFYHCEDGPAVEYSNRGEQWHLYGQKHRIDGWSLSENEGDSKVWSILGVNHCVDGPAVNYANGTQVWLIEGNLHRVGGPAIEEIDGTEVWYQNGVKHRTDGPAIEKANGYKAWWINGELQSLTTLQEETKISSETNNNANNY